MTIKSIKDFCNYWGEDNLDHLARSVYKYTDCGAWIMWDDTGFTIGSIVEGSDAEFSKRFDYPVESNLVDDWFDELDKLTDEAWFLANCEEEDCYE